MDVSNVYTQSILVVFVFIPGVVLPEQGRAATEGRVNSQQLLVESCMAKHSHWFW